MIVTQTNEVEIKDETHHLDLTAKEGSKIQKTLRGKFKKTIMKKKQNIYDDDNSSITQQPINGNDPDKPDNSIAPIINVKKTIN